MSWWEIVKDLLPPLREAIDALRTSKRRKRHLFVLKAVGYRANRVGQRDQAFSLEEIEDALLIAQIGEAIQPETRARVFLTGQATREEERAYEKKRKQQLKLGLPDLRDPQRMERVEAILQEMVEERKLMFHPPDRYSVRTR